MGRIVFLFSTHFTLVCRFRMASYCFTGNLVNVGKVSRFIPSSVYFMLPIPLQILLVYWIITVNSLRKGFWDFMVITSRLTIGHLTFHSWPSTQSTTLYLPATIVFLVFKFFGVTTFRYSSKTQTISLFVNGQQKFQAKSTL